MRTLSAQEVGLIAGSDGEVETCDAYGDYLNVAYTGVSGLAMVTYNPALGFVAPFVAPMVGDLADAYGVAVCDATWGEVESGISDFMGGLGPLPNAIMQSIFMIESDTSTYVTGSY